MFRKALKANLGIIISLAMVFNPLSVMAEAEYTDIQVEADAENLGIAEENLNDSLAITESQGYEEGAYAKWTLVSGAKAYKAYVSSDKSNWTQLDNELIRTYADYMRVDALGLKAGDYYLKIVPVDGSGVDMTALVTDKLTVESYDRSGFAFSNNSRRTDKDGLGAYKKDGTLKAGAKVIYVDAATAKTVTANLSTGTFTGLQGILAAKEKAANDGDILDIRIIGMVNASDMDSFGSSSEGLQIKGNKSYEDLNITIEGVGDDALIYGWGIFMRNACDVELRNLGIKTLMDDDVSIDTDNSDLWLHNLDLFYGKKGSGDHVKGDGALDIKGNSQYTTISYNHFFDTGKSSMCGMKQDNQANYITYHHNWFDHSDSRHPRIRRMSVHIYNNYFDGIAKYAVGMTNGGSAFVESNYFRDCKYPMLISLQGNDAYGGTNVASGDYNTFSGENGGIIKSYNNVMVGTYSYIPYNCTKFVQKGKEVTYSLSGTTSKVDFDAVEVGSRDSKIDTSIKCKAGGTTYDNFDTDTNIDLGVKLSAIDDVNQVPTIVQKKAGRINGGNIKMSFSDSDDSSYAINSELENMLAQYTQPVVAVGGQDSHKVNESKPSTPTIAPGATTAPGATSTPVRPDIDGLMIFDLTSDDDLEGISIVGSDKSGESGVYDGYSYSGVGRKTNSDFGATFTVSSTYDLVLYCDKSASGVKIKVNGVSYPVNNGFVEVKGLTAGVCNLAKGEKETALLAIHVYTDDLPPTGTSGATATQPAGATATQPAGATATPPAGVTPGATATPPAGVTPGATATPPAGVTPGATATPPAGVTLGATATPPAGATPGADDNTKADAGVLVTKQKVDVSGLLNIDRVVNPKIKYISSNKKVASVNGKGIVAGKLKTGTENIVISVINAKTRDTLGSISVKVVAPVVTKKIERSVSMIQDKSQSAIIELSEYFVAEGAKPTGFASSNPEIATVDENGKITVVATAKGATKITYVVGEGKNAAKFKVGIKVRP